MMVRYWDRRFAAEEPRILRKWVIAAGGIPGVTAVSHGLRSQALGRLQGLQYGNLAVDPLLGLGQVAPSLGRSFAADERSDTYLHE